MKYFFYILEKLNTKQVGIGRYNKYIRCDK